MKTGAARIALGAISGFGTEERIDLKIIPVGLFYTSKTRFRSEVLLYFGQPIDVLPVEPDKDGGPPRGAVRDLTDRIEEALRDVTVNSESRAEIETANEAANLFLSVSETMDLEEPLAARFDFVRNFLSGYDPEGGLAIEGEEITGLVSDYKKKLRKLGLEPENLSLSKQPYWYVFRHFILHVMLLALFLPFTLVGIVLHVPAYELTRFLGSRYTKHGADDIVSTVKIVSGLVFMPLTWIITALAAGYFWNWELGLLAAPIAALCGYSAMRSLESIADLRGWFRAVMLFFRKRELFIQLLLERRNLHKRLKGLE